MKKARHAFSEYLKSYDTADSKIRLKIVHTQGVIRFARDIASRMELSPEDVQLAELIALLHDIGRFEQVRLYDSFMPSQMDHAVFGVETLFGPGASDDSKPVQALEESLISAFCKDAELYPLIRDAILYHNRFALPEITDPRTLLHARLIRDADKLDNCRVKLTEAIPDLFGMTESDIASSSISDAVWASCQRRESVLSSDRVTAADYWVSYLAVYFDLNFRESWDILRENDYPARIVGRINYTNPETADRMLCLVQMLSEFGR